MMIDDNLVIETLDDLEAFLRVVENGGLGLQDVSGIATGNQQWYGRPFYCHFR